MRCQTKTTMGAVPGAARTAECAFVVLLSRAAEEAGQGTLAARKAAGSFLSGSSGTQALELGEVAGVMIRRGDAEH